MKAIRVFYYKDKRPDGLVIEAVIWQLPAPTPARPTGIKYRLYCGRHGRCVVRYDNESGKGDHIHVSNQELPYHFAGVGKLVQDFFADVTRLTGVTP